MTQGFYQGGNLLMTFATPLPKRQWPGSRDLNRRLRKTILENRGERISLAFNIRLRF